MDENRRKDDKPFFCNLECLLTLLRKERIRLLRLYWLSHGKLNPQQNYLLPLENIRVRVFRPLLCTFHLHNLDSY